jgi:hypothetical protein
MSRPRQPSGDASTLLIAATNLALDAAGAEVADALRQSGERCILLRGATTVDWLYGNDPRAYSDIDFLVDPARFAHCEAVLESLDFRRSRIEAAFAGGSPAHASTWIRGAACVDLHRTVIGVGCSPEVAWRVLSKQTESFELAGRDVEALRPAARALVLALHTAHQGDEFPHTRDDLARAIAVVPHDQWLWAAALAARLDAAGAMGSGLVRVPEGVPLAAELGLEPEVGRPIEGSGAFHVAQAVRWLWLTPGLRGKVRFAFEKLFPTRVELRSRSRLAHRGPLGLGLAYVLRLGSLLTHGPAAVRGLMRMRRGAAARERTGDGRAGGA